MYTLNILIKKTVKMSNRVLLVSEDTIRTYSEISDNLYGKSILPAIRTAQDIYLQGFLGSCLYQKLLSLVADGTIVDNENVQYKDLLDDYIEPYMIERVIADLIPIVGSKIVNLGAIRTNDEYASNIPAGEVDRLQYLHITKADHYAKRMQHFLKLHKEAFPELDCCGCGADIKPNLESAEDCGIFLGGYRAKIVR